MDVDELIAETLDFDSSELDELLESIHMVRSREFQSFITYPYKMNTNRANTHIREVPSMKPHDTGSKLDWRTRGSREAEGDN